MMQGCGTRELGYVGLRDMGASGHGTRGCKEVDRIVIVQDSAEWNCTVNCRRFGLQALFVQNLLQVINVESSSMQGRQIWLPNVTSRNFCALGRL